jgi:hypothetical protein
MSAPRGVTLLVALAAAVVAAGCGGGSSAGSAAPPSSPSASASASPSPSASPTPSPTGPNGIAALPPNAALAKISAAAAAQHSVHVRGAVSQGSRTLDLDLRAGTDSGEGTLRVGGGTIGLRLLAGTLYIHGDAKGLAALGFPKADIGAAADKWLSAPASGISLSALLSFDDLVKSVVTPTGKVVRGRTTTIDGTRVYSLIDRTKNGGVLYVTTSGDPLPVRINNPRQHEHIDFSDWDLPLSVTAPSPVVPLPTTGSSPAS